jgi:DNA modification methylase
MAKIQKNRNISTTYSEQQDRPQVWRFVADLKPWPDNPRTHSEEQIERLCLSIKEFGFTRPILIDEDDFILVGHGCTLAAARLDHNPVPCRILYGLTQDQKAALVVADNELASEGSGWDMEKLKTLISGIDLDNLQLPKLGFSDEGWVEMLNWQPEQLPAGGLTDPDAAPEPLPHAISALGDIWLLGNHRVMCGDATSVSDLDRLMRASHAEMMFTDPPYGVDYEGGHFYSGDPKIVRKREKLAGAECTIYGEFLPVIKQYVEGPCYVWYASTKSYEVFKALHEIKADIHQVVLWHKINAQYGALNAQYKPRHEPCVYFKMNGNLRWCGASNESTLWEVKRESKNSYHPTQKPVELAERALKNHTATTVLDCFGGSGSTLIAAQKTGRTAYIMELSPQYVDVIVRRWCEFTGESATREADGVDWLELKLEQEVAP